MATLRFWVNAAELTCRDLTYPVNVVPKSMPTTMRVDEDMLVKVVFDPGS